MKIAKDKVVSLEYTIRNEAGLVIDSSEGRQPLDYLHGYSQIVPGVEAAIEGLSPGAEMEIDVTPEDAYGDRDPSAILVLPRHLFPDEEDLEAGTMFRAYRPDGKPVIFSIIDVTPETVIVDANHPLAGQTLHVRVLVLGVREASDEERAHRHVHDRAETSTPAMA